MDIFEALRQDQDQILSLVAALWDAQNQSAEARHDALEGLLDRLRFAMQRNQKAEDEVFYVIFERDDATRAYGSLGRQSHRMIAETLAAMEPLSSDDPLWHDNYSDLRALIENHIDEEQRELIPLARRIVSSEEEAKRLGDLYERAKERGPQPAYFGGVPTDREGAA